MQNYIMALDQGTTSSRCILFDRQGNICSMAQMEFKQIFPKPGYVRRKNFVFGSYSKAYVLLIYQIGQNHKCYEKVIYASGFLLLAVTLDSPVLFLLLFISL